MPELIHIGSDHAGLDLKNALKTHLEARGFTIRDHGAHSPESTDYPLYAQGVCQAVFAENGRGILICGTGIGMSIAANRNRGIRAALCACEFHARACREHNNANILCLGSRITATGLAASILDIFLDTPFAGGRHQGRIELIENAMREPLCSCTIP
ncbi:MAG: ribose 5-phosphate isomerase B [Deltaproteobacteria bacterium]|jgi:ribose 5-phosphate isomerase B|nr:ribose 5-phosphate isomerase B [Deltaproteobacteria bacterium]